jgi:hypothetical protein
MREILIAMLGHYCKGDSDYNRTILTQHDWQTRRCDDVQSFSRRADKSRLLSSWGTATGRRYGSIGECARRRRRRRGGSVQRRNHAVSLSLHQQE